MCVKWNGHPMVVRVSCHGAKVASHCGAHSAQCWCARWAGTMDCTSIWPIEIRWISRAWWVIWSQSNEETVKLSNLSYAGLVNGRLPAVYVATAEDLLGRRATGHTDSGQSWCKWLKFAAKTAKAYTHAYLLEFVGEEHTFVVRTWARVYRTDHTCSTGFCQEQFYR